MRIMGMSGWREFYDSGEFSIDTTEPGSLLVRTAFLIPPDSRVADIGCGAGRNAIYLATLLHDVDASDVVDLGWYERLPEHLKAKINFQVAATDDLELEEDTYGAILMMRLLQYLSPEEVTTLLRKTGSALMSGGIALASYVVSGGKDKSSFGITDYPHPPEAMIESFTEAGLDMIASRTLQTVSRHVPYHAKVNVCELVARKPA